MGFCSKFKWLFSSNPKHEINKKMFQLDLKKREIKSLERGLKTNVNKLQDHTIKLVQLQKHFHTNHNKTLKEVQELKEFKQEKKEIDKVLKSLHNLLAHVPDEVAEEFAQSKEFLTFEKVMAKHFKEYRIR